VSTPPPADAVLYGTAAQLAARYAMTREWVYANALKLGRCQPGGPGTAIRFCLAISDAYMAPDPEPEAPAAPRAPRRRRAQRDDAPIGSLTPGGYPLLSFR
jgi:hypothetical protein